MNVAEILADSSAHPGTRPLLRFEGRELTRDETFARARALTRALLDDGVKRGDRVVLLARNTPEWIVSMIAIIGAGAIAVPVNPALTASEIAHIVGHSKPVLIFADDDLEAPPAARDGTTPMAAFSSDEEAVDDDGFVDCDPDDPAVLFYTSGTTGRPKGVLLSHRNVIAVTDIAIGSLLPLARDDRERSLVCGSLSFIYTIITNSFSCIRTGRTIVLQDHFNPVDAWRAIADERITMFLGVPTMFTMLLNRASDHAVDASSLRFCLSSGQNLPWDVARRFEERFGLPVYDFWGQTEGTPITGYDPSTEARARPDSCGRALPGCGVRVIGDDGADLAPEATGEVLLAGPCVMLGYYDDPVATAATLRDGWIHTGDLGRLDEDGYLHIVGRKRDMIIRGGANIYPVEIEEVLYAHPAVLESAVVGVPDALYGETVRAYVVLRPGVEASADDLRAHCALSLAAYKVPATVLFIDALPKGPTGKILKRVLQARAASDVPPH